MFKYIFLFILSFFCAQQSYASDKAIFLQQTGDAKHQTLDFICAGSVIASVELSQEDLVGITDYKCALNERKSKLEMSYKANNILYKQDLAFDFNSTKAILTLTANKSNPLRVTVSNAKGLYVTMLGKSASYSKTPLGVQIFSVGKLQLVFNLDKRIESDSVSYAQAEWVQQKSQLDKLHHLQDNYYLRLPKSKHADLLKFNKARYYRLNKKMSAGLWAGIVMADSTAITPDMLTADSLFAARLVDFSQGLIDILPALPAAWTARGRMVGAEGPGGFVVDLVWDEGEIKTLVLRSGLGGNCRLRVPHDIDACSCLGMQEAKGENPNPAFNVASLPLSVSSSKKTSDFLTYAGQVVVISGK